MKNILLIVLSLTLIISCNSPKTADSQSATPEEPAYTLTELWKTDTTMLTCESVFFDKHRQVLYVSCINGGPGDKDGKGYLAKLDLDGNVLSREWVSGLNAPKGMGLMGDKLYVTDIDELVIIDITRAEVLEKLPVEGAGFLNDIAIDKDGTIYFTDSNEGSVWKYKDGIMTAWITEGLERPNGLYIEKDRVLLTSSKSSDLKVLDKTDGSAKVVTTDIGHGDGVEFTGREGYYIVSNWSGEIFLILPDFSKVSLLHTAEQKVNSADIAINKKELIVYVPTFFDNRVVAYKLSIP